MLHYYLAGQSTYICTYLGSLFLRTQTGNVIKPQNTTVFYRGEHVITFDTPTTEAQGWDLYQRGPRIFLFRQESFYFVV